ncbi:MAG: sigma-70 family RNA polymerase sigma factor [Saprospiraceae bacterium]|nr:sigma-70 family RNA polymerase sigma factor [Saprospiraceae bacterium]
MESTQVEIKKQNNQYFIDGIRNNNSKIINEIYEKYSKAITHYVTTNNGTSEDARDVFQEGMIVLFKKIHTPDFELTSSLLTYFYSLCKFIWSNKLRKKQLNIVEIEDTPELMDSHSIQEDLEHKERSDFYIQKFKQLGDGCQKVLTLFYEGTKMKQIAEIMGFASSNYATKRKHKCKEQLMKLVTEDDFYNEISLV